MSFPKYPRYKDSGVEWLGDVPEHWKMTPLWTNFRRVKRVGFGDEELLSVYRDHGVIPKSSRDDNFNKPSDDMDAYQLVEPGDLVINKMKAWQGSVAISDHRGIVSPAYFVYTSLHSQHSRYLHYLLRSPQYTAGYLSLSKGIRIGQWDLEPEKHSRMPVLQPTIDEQIAIASFLDEETAKIEALVAAQQRLIELLKEKRQAVISHAVTRGLDPDAPMEPSNVEALAEIPYGWHTSRITKYLRSIVDYRGRTPTKVEDGTFLLTARNIRDGSIDYNASEEFIDPTEYESTMRRGVPALGDVVFTTEAPLGQVANLNRTDIAIAQRIIKFSGIPGVLDNCFLKYWIMGSYCQAELMRLATGSTVVGIKGSKLGEIPLLLPPIAEQMAIVRFLDATTTALDALVAEAERAIALLQERRTALISAAVTGKIDVRNLVEAA